MKNNCVFIFLLFVTAFIKAQDYQISFTGSGQIPNVNSLFVKNLTQGTTLELDGSDILHLKVNTGINSQLSIDDNVIIYPNPASDKLFIETEIEVSSISICNELGQIVITQDMNNTSEIAVSNLQPGVYVLNAYGNEGELVGKFKVVKK